MISFNIWNYFIKMWNSFCASGFLCESYGLGRGLSVMIIILITTKLWTIIYLFLYLTIFLLMLLLSWKLFVFLKLYVAAQIHSTICSFCLALTLMTKWRRISLSMKNSFLTRIRIVTPLFLSKYGIDHRYYTSSCKIIDVIHIWSIVHMLIERLFLSVILLLTIACIVVT